MGSADYVLEVRLWLEICLGLERQAGNMTNYHLGDFLIRLKNAAMANLKEVSFPKTKLVLAVAQVLKKEKFIDEIKVLENKIVVTLTYYSKKPILTDVAIVSKPGLRIYMNVDKIEKIKSPYTFIFSTNKGVMTKETAVKERIGGELIAKVI